jgi:hypothetical protein
LVVWQGWARATPTSKREGNQVLCPIFGSPISTLGNSSRKFCSQSTGGKVGEKGVVCDYSALLLSLVGRHTSVLTVRMIYSFHWEAPCQEKTWALWFLQLWVTSNLGSRVATCPVVQMCPEGVQHLPSLTKDFCGTSLSAQCWVHPTILISFYPQGYFGDSVVLPCYKHCSVTLWLAESLKTQGFLCKSVTPCGKFGYQRRWSPSILFYRQRILPYICLPLKNNSNGSSENK